MKIGVRIDFINFASLLKTTPILVIIVFMPFSAAF
jgi:hypothetical protein